MKCNIKKLSIILLLLQSVLYLSCASSPVNFENSPAWEDLDREPVPEPVEVIENQLWDIMDHTFFYEVGKALDPIWTSRKIGNIIGVSGRKEADNANSLDEAPNSSWFTNRHFYNRLSIEELIRGPNSTDGPDTSSQMVIIRGKFEGGTPGFTIRDSRGDVYIMKFDAADYIEMGSSAEVITTKIYHAAGYNVPQNFVVYFDPNKLVVGETAQIAGEDKIKRKMTMQDIMEMLEGRISEKTGLIRAGASKYLQGKPIGPFEFHGRRQDDHNDRVEHEHRRELRGMRIIASWLNDGDRRAANTLDMYVTQESEGGFVRHYLLDFGSALGSNNLMPHPPKYGNEYIFDFRTLFKSILMLGFYEKPWAYVDSMQYTTTGYFESEIFTPQTWVPTYPNPAFENMTLRDAYWGTKIVASFTDEDISALVSTGQLSNPNAEAYLIKTLIERRDKIVAYWFGKMNPVDRFEITMGLDAAEFRFVDLAVEAGVVNPDESSYLVDVRRDSEEDSQQSVITYPLTIKLKQPSALSDKGSNYTLTLQTRRGESAEWSKKVTLFIAYRKESKKYEIVAVRRES